MTIQTIVLDFGRVVGLFDHRLTTNRLAPYAGVSPDELHAILFGSSFENDYEAGRLSTDEFLAKVLAEGQLNCTKEKVASAWADIFWPNSDVIALLPRLRGRYRLLLGSNTNELHTRQFALQFADAFSHFDHLVYSYQIGVRKPAAGFFDHCRRLADCPPEACVFIDDILDNVEGARACGWHGFQYTSIDDLRRDLAGLDIVV
jgi:putative hydrolase of the HAD superfamily